MNRHFDCNNCNDFVEMCCMGELCPNKQVEMRSIGGDRIIKIAWEDQLRKLCKDNNTNILEILMNIHDKIMGDMLVRGNNIPVFKKRVNSVLEQWKQSPQYDDFFTVRDKERTFYYDDLLKCNSVVLDLGKQMEEIGDMVSNQQDNVYTRVIDLQNNCRDADNHIKVCIGDIDAVADYYEPRNANVLLDLSTKPKSFYTQMDDNPEKLKKLIYHKSFREIPENLPEIFSNAVFVPNMITKETDYIKELLRNLHNNVRDKQLVLADLRGNIPEQTTFLEPFHQFFKSLPLLQSSDSDSSDESDESSDDESESMDKPESGDKSEGTKPGTVAAGATPLTKTQVSDIEGLLVDVDKEIDESKLKMDVKEYSEDIDEEKPEKELIKIAKMQQGGNYGLSFF